MKLVELLYQNRDKFTLHDDCTWIAQDDDDFFIGQFSNNPKPRKNGMCYSGEFFIDALACCADYYVLSEDWQTPLSRSDYEQYCKEQDEKLLSDIDNALIRHDQGGALAAVFLEHSHAYKENELSQSTKASLRKNKYQREIKPGVFVDVYDVLKAWDVKNPALQHLIKKALQPGERGHKDLQQDLDDIIASALRAKDLEQ